MVILDPEEMVKGAWTVQEDNLLTSLVQRHGTVRSWSVISRSIPGRNPSSCRNRWLKQLSPEVNHLPFTPEEDQLILEMHADMGNKWTEMARLLDNGRTDNSVKNRWHSTLKRRRDVAVLAIEGVGAAGQGEAGEGGAAGEGQRQGGRQGQGEEGQGQQQGDGQEGGGAGQQGDGRNRE
ncbi:transcription factor MYB73-like [Impatiens glandulifera]|uniref:transcription factor MYB73-like n=1 Tax=Impatiens glandulifera TaxID=253017 RepID=UPI001FB0DFB6|nr:transcription factor MYB73-like [Impatiens glandulifera]